MGYAIFVAVLSLFGAAVPLRVRPGHAELQLYLSVAAGALLGAALFHLLPESSHKIGTEFGLPAAAGILLVFLLQRYVAPHSHEADGPEHDHAHDEHASHHDHEHEHVHEQIAAAPSLGGLIAILGLSVHSFFDGVALGAAGSADGKTAAVGTFAVFLSVFVHKPLDGLSVSVLLLKAGTSRSKLWLIQGIYAALVPVGTLAFILTRGAVENPAAFIGYTLAFSAGAFLSIALTDLLPELHFHKHDRHKLTFAMLLGIGIMYAATWLETLLVPAR